MLKTLFYQFYQSTVYPQSLRGGFPKHHIPCNQMLAVVSGTVWSDCFFNIWPFTTVKSCPKSPKQGFPTLPNIKFTFKMLPNISKFLLNFAKSGHTGWRWYTRQFWSHNLQYKNIHKIGHRHYTSHICGKPISLRIRFINN